MSVVDTNVLVHSIVATSPYHAVARKSLADIAASGPVAISRQILREFLSVTTRPQPWMRPATLADAMKNADAFMARFTILEDGPAVWSELSKLTRSVVFGGKQVHDANIVATMLAHGETRLLTFNEADFRRFGTLIELIVPC